MTMQDRIDIVTPSLIQESGTQILDPVDFHGRANLTALLATDETIRSGTTEVIKMIHRPDVREHFRILSMHSQVEPTGSKGQTAMVCVV